MVVFLQNEPQSCEGSTFNQMLKNKAFKKKLGSPIEKYSQKTLNGHLKRISFKKKYAKVKIQAR